MTDSVTIESAATSAEGPNDSAMAQAYENQGADQNTDQQPEGKPQEKEQGGDRPDWLPEKFKSPEDMAKAYTQLEKRLGSGESQEDAGNKSGEGEQDDKGGKPRIETNDAKEQAEQAIGSDAMQKYSQEFAQSGELSEDSYKELQDKGIPKEMVDAYIEGQKAVAERQLGELYETAGSQDALNEAMQWAAGALDQADIDAFNATMESGNLGQMKLAVRGLMAEHAKANGSEGTRVSGSAKGGSANSDVYDDMSQVVRDMSSSEYRESPAFRKQVEAKLARSSVI